MNSIIKKAMALGASDFGISTRKVKRFFVKYDDKIIHFGSKSGQTFYDHKDKMKLNKCRAYRIRTTSGTVRCTVTVSPEGTEVLSALK